MGVLGGTALRGPESGWGWSLKVGGSYILRLRERLDLSRFSSKPTELALVLSIDIVSVGV